MALHETLLLGFGPETAVQSVVLRARSFVSFVVRVAAVSRWDARVIAASFRLLGCCIL